MPLDTSTYFEPETGVERVDDVRLDVLRQHGPAFRRTWLWPIVGPGGLRCGIRDTVAVVRRDEPRRSFFVAREREFAAGYGREGLLETEWTDVEFGELEDVAPTEPGMRTWLEARPHPGYRDWPHEYVDLPQ